MSLSGEQCSFSTYIQFYGREPERYVYCDVACCGYYYTRYCCDIPELGLILGLSIAIVSVIIILICCMVCYKYQCCRRKKKAVVQTEKELSPGIYIMRRA